MKYFLSFSLSFILLVVIGIAAYPEDITIEKLPPVIVKTLPVSGSMNVDPSVRIIKVTFSKPMMTKKMWSWVMISKDSFPQMTGDPYYLEDGKTCLLPVKLQKDKTYAIWINSGKYNYFKDKNGNPAVPYLLVFRTAK